MHGSAREAQHAAHPSPQAFRMGTRARPQAARLIGSLLGLPNAAPEHKIGALAPPAPAALAPDPRAVPAARQRAGSGTSLLRCPMPAPAAAVPPSPPPIPPLEPPASGQPVSSSIPAGLTATLPPCDAGLVPPPPPRLALPLPLARALGPLRPRQSASSASRPSCAAIASWMRTSACASSAA